jgi:hypothetical protein
MIMYGEANAILKLKKKKDFPFLVASPEAQMDAHANKKKNNNNSSFLFL